MSQSIPFDPRFERVTHEYRVTVSSRGLLFQTSWYIESHARDVLASLKQAYPNGAVTLHKRAMAGDAEVVR